jgi:hypothetical protein
MGSPELIERNVRGLYQDFFKRERGFFQLKEITEMWALKKLTLKKQELTCFLGVRSRPLLIY